METANHLSLCPSNRGKPSKPWKYLDPPGTPGGPRGRALEGGDELGWIRRQSASKRHNISEVGNITRSTSLVSNLATMEISKYPLRTLEEGRRYGCSGAKAGGEAMET